jgi:hypothetical protein
MPDVLKYLIVDDEEIDRLAIESEADKFPFLKRIASCSHPLLAAELIRAWMHCAKENVLLRYLRMLSTACSVPLGKPIRVSEILILHCTTIKMFC